MDCLLSFTSILRPLRSLRLYFSRVLSYKTIFFSYFAFAAESLAKSLLTCLHFFLICIIICTQFVFGSR